jgi:hypothetical protein
MEESNISSVEKSIQSIDTVQKLFIHLIKPDFMPVGTVFKSVQDLDSILDNSCQEIVINDLFDYLSYNDSSNILDTLIKKLSSNGYIIIQSVDLYQFACSIAFEDIDLDTSKMILYPNKKAIYTLYDIELELQNRKLDIVEKKYLNIFEYYIRAQKII